MKLQVNLKGSWRDVLHSFPEKHEPEVRASAGRLAFLAGGKCKFRIADDENRALAYCEAPFFTWKNAFRGTGSE
ncbi:hypothetical protein EBAPG3_010335 [Nitrosospira lacus]|uniref:Uncharacterized protein n=1 Tax=Nitrosospira lacus TaxID=1288494 RepID=A0A1W6SQS9_9PROT|nr:hypothetical protein [Nitrosospira lacus]ARO88139.1 hypothetical protein EBAPG3_010335 [Nitrosospira lacus]